VSTGAQAGQLRARTLRDEAQQIALNITRLPKLLMNEAIISRFYSVTRITRWLDTSV
jgi:hypothetical protein